MGRKVNPMLAKIQARHEIDLRFQREFTIQRCCDMMLIAANDAFGFGADRLNRLEEVFFSVFTEYAEKALDDGKDDPDIIYTRSMVYRKLQQIMGKHFRPWEERYGGTE